MTVDESLIPEHNRISRVTSATWKYENGAVGSFVHLTALQGHDYSCELEVFADGYQMKCVSLPSARVISIANQSVFLGSSTHTCSLYSMFVAQVATRKRRTRSLMMTHSSPKYGCFHLQGWIITYALRFDRSPCSLTTSRTSKRTRTLPKSYPASRVGAVTSGNQNRR